jgi:hypothetical protein
MEIYYWANQGVFFCSMQHFPVSGTWGKVLIRGKRLEMQMKSSRVIISIKCGFFYALGSFLESKLVTIKHLILKAPHPGPLSSYRVLLEQNTFHKSKWIFDLNWGKTPIALVKKSLEKFSRGLYDIRFLLKNLYSMSNFVEHGLSIYRGSHRNKPSQRYLILRDRPNNENQ